MFIKEINDKEDFTPAFNLIRKVFDTFVAPDYPQEGIDSFYEFVNPEFLQSLSSRNGFVLCAYENEILAGVIAVRDSDHVALFFVDSIFQNQGIGRKLLSEVISKIAKNDITAIRVHSSPFAVKCYENLGFIKENSELIEHGIRYTPMVLNINIPFQK